MSLCHRFSFLRSPLTPFIIQNVLSEWHDDLIKTSLEFYKMNALIQVMFVIPEVTNNAYLMERGETNDQVSPQTKPGVSSKNL
jgi:hypothetical protein